MHIITIFESILVIFDIIMDVLRFVSFESDRNLLCRISRKVFAKKSETNQKNYALSHPLIRGQMSKSSKHAY